MIIGVDFDNTIVCYDQVFYQAAVEQGLIPSEIQSNKNSVRDYLRQTGKEDAWTELQGMVYGVYIKYAPAFPGVIDFFRHCRRQEIIIYIISHKTRYPFIGAKHNLHLAAHKWLENQGVYGQTSIDLSPEKVFFELTKEEKLNRISHVGCTHFIDDLPEFLEEPDFPSDIERILFDPNNIYPTYNVFQKSNSWLELEKLLNINGHVTFK